MMVVMLVGRVMVVEGGKVVGRIMVVVVGGRVMVLVFTVVLVGRWKEESEVGGDTCGNNVGDYPKK